jgi:hypothetical protein
MRQKHITSSFNSTFEPVPCPEQGHRLKNKDSKLFTVLMKEYVSKRKLILTGTPLQNNINELWNLLNFLMPTVFDTDQDFKSWFSKVCVDVWVCCGSASYVCLCMCTCVFMHMCVLVFRFACSQSAIRLRSRMVACISVRVDVMDVVIAH